MNKIINVIFLLYAVSCYPALQDVLPVVVTVQSGPYEPAHSSEKFPVDAKALDDILEEALRIFHLEQQSTIQSKRRITSNIKKNGVKCFIYHDFNRLGSFVRPIDQLFEALSTESVSQHIKHNGFAVPPGKFIDQSGCAMTVDQLIKELTTHGFVSLSTTN